MKLSNCCGCIPLKAGLYIIAKLTIIIPIGILKSFPEARKFLSYNSSTFSPTIFTYFVFWFILPVILIIGVHRMSSTITLVYLCGGIINFGIINYFFIILLIEAFTSADKSLYFFTTLVPIVYGYFLLVVYNFYRELKKNTVNQVVNELPVES